MTLITLRRRLGKPKEAPGRIINGSGQQKAQPPPRAEEQARDPGAAGRRVKWGHRLASASLGLSFPTCKGEEEEVQIFPSLSYILFVACVTQCVYTVFRV